MKQEKIPLSQFFSELAQNCSQEKLELGQWLDQLVERGTGLLSLFIAATYLIPVPMPGISFLLALTLVFCSVLFLFQKKLILPAFIYRYELKGEQVQKVALGLSRIFQYSEKIVRPRAGWLIPLLGGRFLVSLVLFISALVFMLPLPFGLNIPTAIMAVLVTWGYLEDDAYAILAGFLVLFLQIVVVMGLINIF